MQQLFIDSTQLYQTIAEILGTDNPSDICSFIEATILNSNY